MASKLNVLSRIGAAGPDAPLVAAGVLAEGLESDTLRVIFAGNRMVNYPPKPWLPYEATVDMLGAYGDDVRRRLTIAALLLLTNRSKRAGVTIDGHKYEKTAMLWENEDARTIYIRYAKTKFVAKFVAGVRTDVTLGFPGDVI